MAVRRMLASEVSLLRALRLRALQTDPLSFGSTYEREAAFDDAFWSESAQRHAGSDACAMFFAGDKGLVRTAADPARPGVFFIHSMWVAPEARGQGLASELLDAAEAWARERGATVCELMVTDRAPVARRLYERRGYVADGHTEPSPHAGVVEHRMIKKL
jgi:GNAT superfamily N-acetyltransferase